MANPLGIWEKKLSSFSDLKPFGMALKSVFLLLLCYGLGKCEEEHHLHTELTSCSQVIAYMVKKMLAPIPECVKELGLTNGKERAFATNCIMKCTLQKEGILDAEGQPDVYSITNFVILEIPEAFQNVTFSVMDICREAGVNLTNDKDCKSYSPMIKCMLDHTPTMCDGFKEKN